ncbi:MAG: SGNH/GDSL hydrolase family protein [Rikenellaceae bacterium]|nr:SGNH/GDSL hydrolase family protein [Rikenellaceae bacterium]
MNDLQKITEGMTGRESSDIVYNNDLLNRQFIEKTLGTNIIPEDSRLNADTLLVTDTDGKGIGAGIFTLRYPNDPLNLVVKNLDNSFNVSLAASSGNNSAFWALNWLDNTYLNEPMVLSFYARRTDGLTSPVLMVNTGGPEQSVTLTSEWKQYTLNVTFNETYPDNRLMFYIVNSSISIQFDIRDITLYLVSEDGIIQEVNTLKREIASIGEYSGDILTLNGDSELITDSGGKGIGAGNFDIRFAADPDNWVEKTDNIFKVNLKSLGTSSNPAFWAINKVDPSYRGTTLLLRFYIRGDVASNVTLNTDGNNQNIMYNTDFEEKIIEITFGNTYGDMRLMFYVAAAGTFYIRDLRLIDPALTLVAKTEDIDQRVKTLESKDPENPTEDINNIMANYLSKTARVLYGDNTQCIIGLLGDSWTQHTATHTKYVTPLAKSLREQYGDAGGGFYSFNISHIGSGDAKMQSVDPDDADDTRIARLQPDGITTNIDYRDQVDGCRWVDAADATFKTGAWLNLNIKKPHNRLVIHFYGGAGAGTFTYTLDGGAAVSVNAAEYSTGHNIISLDVSDSTHTLRFDVTAGSVMLFGVDMQRTNPGVRIHKLGNKGSTTRSFVIVDTPVWQQGLASLGLDSLTILLGTNDGPNATTSVYENLKTVISNVRAVNQFVDLALIMPSNAKGRDMSRQAVSQYQLAKEVNVGFVNLIPLFGSPEQIEEKGTFYDTLHPTMQSGLMIARHLRDTLFK